MARVWTCIQNVVSCACLNTILYCTLYSIFHVCKNLPKGLLFAQIHSIVRDYLTYGQDSVVRADQLGASSAMRSLSPAQAGGAPLLTDEQLNKHYERQIMQKVATFFGRQQKVHTLVYTTKN